VVIYYGGKVQAMGTLKELLARPDAIRITTPTLPRETMERVLDLIRKDVTSDKVRVETPTQNLESYFLEVVRSARQAAAETSGATSGARVAAYLRGSETEAAASSDRILERLTLPSAPAQPATAPSAEPAQTVDEKKLDELTRSAEPTPAPAAAPETSAPRAEDLEKANEKLSSLLGKPK
jgi:hypothetical protein